MIHLRTEEEIQKLRKSAALLVKTFREVEKHLQAGIQSIELDRIAEETIRKGGGRPAFKGYHGYPASICASINEAVVHGIPNQDVLKNGDLVSIDIGVELNGYYSDAAKSYGIGAISREKKKLMEITKSSLYQGIAQCRAGKKVSDISHAVQTHVESNGASVVRALVGHGIGREMHEEPQIPNYGRPNRGAEIRPGMVFAIEPMVNLGSYEVEVLEDGWTVETKDKLPSAHFEHTVVVTLGEPEILTAGLDETLET